MFFILKTILVQKLCFQKDRTTEKGKFQSSLKKLLILLVNLLISKLQEDWEGCYYLNLKNY